MRICSWGGMSGEIQSLVRPTFSTDIRHPCPAGRGQVRPTYLVIGNLRSYGDEVLSPDGHYVQTTRCDRNLQIDTVNDTVTAESGVRLDVLQERVRALGYVIPSGFRCRRSWPEEQLRVWLVQSARRHIHGGPRRAPAGIRRSCPDDKAGFRRYADDRAIQKGPSLGTTGISCRHHSRSSRLCAFGQLLCAAILVADHGRHTMYSGQSFLSAQYLDF